METFTDYSQHWNTFYRLIYVAYVLSCIMVATLAFPFSETFMVHINA